MKAIRVVDGVPTFVDAPEPKSSAGGVEIKVSAAGICGSDLHLIDGGFVEGRILGHEFAGHTPDGTAVAVEPVVRCGQCWACEADQWNHCDSMVINGIFADGGMAQRVVVPSECLVPLPSGLDVQIAALVEPLAVAVHAVHRARTAPKDRVAIIGAGPIGLAVAAALSSVGISAHISARHDHQRAAAQRLGATVGLGEGYDVTFDAVGTSESLASAVAATKPMGHVGLVGSLWTPAQIDINVCMKEVELIPASMYCGVGSGSDFATAAAMLLTEPAIAETMVTHRFPLDGAREAFAVAAARGDGSIKVAFDLAS